jgi:hypothetical protein
MTYVTEQTGAELRAHMRSLTAINGWGDPLVDRLWLEVQKLDEEIEALKAWGEDEDLDATDFAHPAWWRGHENGAEMVALRIFAIIDGLDKGHGAMRNPSLERLRRRLLVDYAKFRALEALLSDYAKSAPERLIDDEGV